MSDAAHIEFDPAVQQAALHDLVEGGRAGPDLASHARHPAAWGVRGGGGLQPGRGRGRDLLQLGGRLPKSCLQPGQAGEKGGGPWLGGSQ